MLGKILTTGREYPVIEGAAVRDYDLYNLYVLRFGLTFVPKGLDAEAWMAANHLMWCALQANGPLVTHASIQEHQARLTHYPADAVAFALSA